MSMIKNLKDKIDATDQVIDEFMSSPCCGEDEDTSKQRGK